VSRRAVKTGRAYLGIKTIDSKKSERSPINQPCHFEKRPKDSTRYLISFRSEDETPQNCQRSDQSRLELDELERT
jgi:hypothetical protein